jgi:hypothetical protein
MPGHRVWALPQCTHTCPATGPGRLCHNACAPPRPGTRIHLNHPHPPTHSPPVPPQFGLVRDAIILRDKLTGDSRGCAFVSYGTKEEADAAIAALDRKLHLPGALCPLEVRWGRGGEEGQRLHQAAAAAAAAAAAHHTHEWGPPVPLCGAHLVLCVRHCCYFSTSAGVVLRGQGKKGWCRRGHLLPHLTLLPAVHA